MNQNILWVANKYDSVCLQTYPRRDQSSNGESEYTTADEYLKENPNNKSILTLSASEWEAVSKYQGIYFIAINVFFFFVTIWLI